MIIAVRDILDKIKSEKSNRGEYSIDMVGNGNGYEVAIKDSSNKITIRATDNGRELVGLVIGRPSLDRGRDVLCSNGLFINYLAVKAADTLIFTSYDDACRFAECLFDPAYVSTLNRIKEVIILAAYQERTNNSLTLNPIRIYEMG